MEEILRDSEKGQNNYATDYESSSVPCKQAAGDVSACQANHPSPSLHLILDPSITGTG